MMRKRAAAGFTLIELLVVIAIIGILASLILVALATARTRAKGAKIESDIGQVRTLAELILDETNSTSYQGPSSCLVAATCASTATLDPQVTKLVEDIDLVAGGPPAFHAGTLLPVGPAYCIASVIPGGKGNTASFCADSSGIAQRQLSPGTCTSTSFKC